MDDLLIKGGRLVTPHGVIEADLLSHGERITAIERDIPQGKAEVIHLNGELVLPGGVDVHVHLPWPTGSFVSSDGFDSGTRAAAFGGVTTVLDFVIPRDGDSLPEAVAQKRKLADGSAWVDYGLHINLRGDIRKQIKAVPELVRAGYPSFKLFLAYEGFRLDDDDLAVVLETVAQYSGMVSVHAEDGRLADRLTAALLAEGKQTLEHYPEARPAACEVDAVMKILTLQAQYHLPVHFHHISTSRAAELIGHAKAEGQRVSAETCPHYLVFDQEGYRGDPHFAAQLVCAPSIKSADDREGLWLALQKDWLDIVATDHCPYMLSQKETDLTDFSHTPGGIGGVEFRLPLLFSKGVVAGRLSLERFIELWATNPAKVFGLYPRKGALTVGSDADMVILDPRMSRVLSSTEMHMHADCTPYEGRRVTGWPMATVLRGKLLVRDGHLMHPNPVGSFLPRKIGNS